MLYQTRIFSLLLLMILLSGCHHIQPNTNESTDSKFVQNSLKTWKSVDISADMMYKILGDMYREGQINEAQKNQFIAIGNVIRDSLIVSKEAINTYIWAEQTNANISDSKTKAINALVISAKSFYKMKDEFIVIYKSITGQDIKIPDLFLFDTITDIMIRK